jgi:hypothetical protein
MKKGLIIGIILVIISLGLIIYRETSKVNLHELTNSMKKEENKRVFINATFVAGSITNNYYVMFSGGVQFIVYISDKEAARINKYLLDHEEESYYIEGITKLIPKDMEENGKKFVKEWLDHAHNHEEVEEHDHNISTEDFYQYFGYVYLDTSTFDYIKLIIYITGIIGLLTIIYVVNTKYHLIG